MNPAAVVLCPHCGHEIEGMGAAEAAEYLGVQVPNLRKIPGLPTPMQLRSGPVWVAEELRDFKTSRGSE